MKFCEQPYGHPDEDMLDISIVGDEEEQHRIELEHNLQDISLPLSVTNPSQASDREQYEEPHKRSFSRHARHAYEYEETDETYSLEYPRHNPNLHDTSIFHGHHSSVIDHSNLNNEYESHLYSYRAADDDEGIYPYGGDTVSTAAHHASALTLSAGLTERGGRRAYGADTSLSGAEYDPDRPLENVMYGIAKDMSMFDLNSTRSKAKSRSQKIVSVPMQATFDHDTLDNAADPGRTRRTTRRHFQHLRTSELRGSPSSHSTSEPDTPDAEATHLPPQKLSDALHRVVCDFSPKRPRSAQHTTQNHSLEGQSTTRGHPRIRHPEFNVQPPTPTTVGNSGGSKFSKMAKTLANDIEASQRRALGTSQEDNERAVAQSTTRPSKRKNRHVERSPFQDIANQTPVIYTHSIQLPTNKAVSRMPASGATAAKSESREERSRDVMAKAKNKVQLPDVTGLTSAVGSPMKGHAEWWSYGGGAQGDGVEAHLLHSLTSLQTRLNQLESQNLVSRRRVRELEMELEACKAEVKRERTRVLEREEIIVAQQKEVDRRRKGKGKAMRSDESWTNENRYHEVLEEKKALEALIATLRTHLTRLTAELSSHQALLTELRMLREADQCTLTEKLSDVDRLKAEVERLGGEVEVLRGVVEEGLKERKRARELLNLSADTLSRLPTQDLPIHDKGMSHENVSEDDDEEDELSRQETPTPPPQPHSRTRSQPFPEKTMRTDHATIGSSRLAGSNAECYINDNELERVSAELHERKSERSHSALSQGSVSPPCSGLHSPALPGSRLTKGQSENPGDAGNETELESPVHIRNAPIDISPRIEHNDAPKRTSGPVHSNQQPSRPAGPTPVRAFGQGQLHQQLPTEKAATVIETPFPQIRGERLERLFFSAPDHNVKTCTVCRRRRRPASPGSERIASSWFPPRSHFKPRVEQDLARDEDEGFEEGEDAEIVQAAEHTKGKGKETVAFAEDERLPPQTVLARVLRELEDDFTHYKGIYIELADQYKLMDPASNIAKRNVLAEHLKEVIDILEQKGDQIASLYDLLTFRDKPISESILPGRDSKQHLHPTVPTVVNNAWNRDCRPKIRAPRA